MTTNVRPSANWGVGVTTTPHRQNDLLPQTLRSLAAAGFDNPILFVDGCGNIEPYRRFGLRVVARSESRGNYANWVCSAWETYLANPTADFYAMFEDDLIISRNAAAYLERTATAKDSYYNLYTYPPNQRRAGSNQGWIISNQRGYGAVGLVFRRDVFMRLITTPGLLHHPVSPLVPGEGDKRIDGVIIAAMQGHGCIEYCHSPSILQHTGIVSVIGHRTMNTAPNFAGESFDLLSLLPK